MFGRLAKAGDAREQRNPVASIKPKNAQITKIQNREKLKRAATVNGSPKQFASQATRAFPRVHRANRAANV